MTDNEFLLQDRLQKIRQVINKYGEEKFYISFSGGKDSCVLSDLIDWALPDNEIPRVYADTGIELNMIRDFVYSLAKKDKRIKIIQPSIPIKQMLEEEGYPFKSKEHSEHVERFQRKGLQWAELRYIDPDSMSEGRSSWGCPKKLLYQFDKNYKGLKISDTCCDRLKKDPLHKFASENDKPYTITGIMRSEGGRRNRASCLAFRKNKFIAFQPMAILSKEWEDWFIDEYDVEICDIYKSPYNFLRTGCKGCPFAIELQHELDVLEQYFPNERKQCEYIWKPVYDEYRRLGYRLKK